MVPQNRDIGAFCVLCLIWGSTWIAVKAGLESVPPLFLAGTRFAAAGALLLLPAWAAGSWRIARADWARLALATFLIIVVCYACLFWGMIYVDSGTAAVLEMGLTPIALLGFAVVAGEEHATGRKIFFMGLGLVGLALLLGGTAWESWSAETANVGWKLLGGSAVAFAAFAYGLGSVIARPLLRAYPAATISGATTFIGGLTLILLSLSIEPEAKAAARFDWSANAWAGWLFLVFFGSLIGYSIYMRLLRDIGATRAGMYSFVSPVIAVGLGFVVRNERIGAVEMVGIVLLLTAAWQSMRQPMSPAPLTSHPS